MFLSQGLNPFIPIVGAVTPHDTYAYDNGNTPMGGGTLKPLGGCGGAVDDGTVVLYSGEFVARFNVLHLPADRGFDLDIILVHRSRSDYAGEGHVGNRWDWNLAKHLEYDAGKWYRYAGDGRRDEYVWDAVAVRWNSPPGFYDELHAPSPGSSITSLEIKARDGSVEIYNTTTYWIKEIKDPNGNKITLHWASPGVLNYLIDTHNRRTNFTYLSGRLDKITDAAGRSVQLEYNAYGSLLRIWMPDPANGTAQIPTLFSYDASNRVLTLTDPKAQAYLENAYDLWGRVVNQTYGRGKYYFTYDHVNYVTTVRDRNGNLETWTFEANKPVPKQVVHYMNRGINPTSGASYTTTFTHNSNLELTSIRYPAGNGVQYAYDESNSNPLARGNLLSETVQPLYGSNDDARITTYTYESIHQGLKTVTDPRGNDAAWVPPNGGANSPTRYRTTYAYDYEEASLGDVNDDGVTTQSNGNIVRITYPKANPAGAPHSAFTSQFANQTVTELFTHNAFGQLLNYTAPTGTLTRYRYFPSNGVTHDASDFEGYLKNVTYDAGTGNDPATGKPRRNLQTNYTYDVVGNLLSESGAGGAAFNATYDQACQVTYASGTVNRLGAVMKRNPGVEGVLGRMPKEQRVNITIQRDANRNPTRIEFPSESSLQTFRVHLFTFDSLDNTVTVEVNASRPSGTPASAYPAELVTKYSYDLNGNVVFVQFPTRNSGSASDRDGFSVASYVYDERDQLYTASIGGVTPQFAALSANTGINTTGLVAAASLSTYKNGYDANGNPTTITNSLSRVSRTLYDGFDRPVAYLDPGGNLTVHLYDSNGHLNRTQTYASIPALGYLTHPQIPRVIRDAWGIIRALANPLLPSCDSVPNLGRFTPCNPQYVLASDVRYVYDEHSRLYRVDEARFDSTTHQILPDGPLTANDGFVTSLYEYDAAGRLIRGINDNAHATERVYDGLGYLVRVIDAVGNKIEPTYDVRGALTKVQGTLLDSANPTTTRTFTANITYDANGRVTSLQTPGGAVTRFGYDAAGRLNNQTDPLGNSEQVIYDAADRPIVEIHRPVPGWTPAAKAAEIKVYNDYDSNGRLRRIEDGTGRATTYTYDSHDRLIRTTYADGSSPTYEYDAEGNLIQEEDAVGNVVTYAHDALNRLIRTHVAPAANVSGTVEEYFDYDVLSRPTRIRNVLDSGVQHDLEYAYDSVGNVIVETQDGHAIRRTFDGVGNLINLTYPSLFTVQHTHDANERLQQVRDGLGNLVANYTYLGPSLQSKVAYGNGMVRTATSDAAGRLHEWKYANSGGSLLVGFDYTYDGANRVKSEKKLHDASNSLVFTYDGVDRLTKFERGTLNATRTGVSSYSIRSRLSKPSLHMGTGLSMGIEGA